MTTPTHCLECNAPLSPADTGGVCPKCLLRLGLASQLASGAPGLAGAGFGRDGHIEQPFDFGGYRILRLLGKGGMGAVYEAEQQASGRRVALKVLGTALDSPEMRARFLREGRLAAALNHPNSVFIYGTEEIEGAPVIAMELVAGGTLKDELKRRGPLPVRDAVNAILQVIAGLEAAAASGVLHRDVKPANCFVAADGAVKVGDFGLSVSTLARHDTQLTASGMMLGTPSFAPPEQLRGDELDARADIYSVGATLYALLTGRAPFDGDNAVQVVAAVLDKAPVPLAQFRADLPTGLTEIIERCLAKRREDRFAGYTELHEALLPFSSAVPEPATPGLRFAAGVVDEVSAALPRLAFLVIAGVGTNEYWLTQRTSGAFLVWLAFVVLHIAYYGLAEGRWGAGFGKRLFGLRVTRPTGGAPGLGRGFIRGLVFSTVDHASTVATFFLSTAASYRKAQMAGDEVVSWWWFFAAWALLFVTMRRSNGYANLMDLASGSRVVLRPAGGKRTACAVLPMAVSGMAGLPSVCGPYRVVGAMGAMIAAYDDMLRRAVWICRREPATPVIETKRRDLARPARLRWLQGVREPGTAWDAFEALAGQPFAEVLAGGAPAWAELRHWLLDVTEELDAAAKDGTQPAELSFDHVWVTTTGRAVLLNEAWPAAQPAPRFAGADPATVQSFLSAVAATVNRRTLPLSARPVLKNFAAGTMDRLSFLAGNLRSLLGKPAVLERRRRFLSLALAPIVFGLVGFVSTWMFEHEVVTQDAAWVARFPDLPPLSQVLRLQVRLAVGDDAGDWIPRWKQADALVLAVCTHVAGHYREALRDEVDVARSGTDSLLSDDERLLVRTLFAVQAPPRPEQLAAADATVRVQLAEFLPEDRRWRRAILPAIVGGGLLVLAVVQGLSLIIFGTSAGQRMFGFAVLNSEGEPAGRGRLLWRWITGWTPFSVLITGLVMYQFAGDSAGKMTPVFLGLGLLLLGAGFVVATARPQRGLHDVLAGAWLVPR